MMMGGKKLKLAIWDTGIHLHRIYLFILINNVSLHGYTFPQEILVY